MNIHVLDTEFHHKSTEKQGNGRQQTSPPASIPHAAGQQRMSSSLTSRAARPPTGAAIWRIRPNITSSGAPSH